VLEERIFDDREGSIRPEMWLDCNNEMLAIVAIDENLEDLRHLVKEVALLTGETTTCPILAYSLALDMVKLITTTRQQKLPHPVKHKLECRLQSVRR